MSDYLQNIKEFLDKVGYPVFVGIWLLLRTDKKLDKIIEIHQSLINSLINKKD